MGLDYNEAVVNVSSLFSSYIDIQAEPTKKATLEKLRIITLRMYDVARNTLLNEDSPAEAPLEEVQPDIVSNSDFLNFLSEDE